MIKIQSLFHSSSKIKMSTLPLNSVVFITLLCTIQTVIAHTEQIPALLLISFDGFRWNYLLGRTSTPTFDKMKQEGVYARKGIKSAFVTNTLPNHWTLVTGLYPESHGIIDNHMYDPNIEKPFIPKWQDAQYENDPRYFDAGGEPIWVTNQLKARDGRSGSVMWFGSEHAVKSIRPTLQMPYNDSVSWEKRMDTLVEWFTSINPINLGLVYFNEPDLSGHRYGPESSQVTEKIAEADKIIKYLFDKLEEKDILDDINIIVTSDHGFTDTPADKIIDLDKIVDPSSYQLTGVTPVASFFPPKGRSGDMTAVYANLTKASLKPDSHFKVYLKKDIPERFHYKNNIRTPPIIAIADWQYSFKALDHQYYISGSHGYDNEQQDMHPFFVAMGPSFKKGYVTETFNNVDVYPLMCHLLGIDPAPNNGSLDIVLDFIEEGHHNTWWTLGTYVLVLIIIASVGGVYSVAACRQHRYLKRKMVQLRLSPLHSSIKYPSVTRDSERSRRLLSDEEEEEEDDFDDANEDSNAILDVVGRR